MNEQQSDPNSGNNILDAVSPVKHHKPYSFTRHLARALFPFDAKEKVMVMLMEYTVYLDESENTFDKSRPDEARVYCIAACISTAKKWKKLEKKWNEVLNREMQPRWSEVWPDKELSFHMTDFDNQKNDKFYKDFPIAKRLPLLQELHALMKKYCIKRFATVVPMADYEALTDEQKAAFRHPHESAMVNCMKEIMIWGDRVGLKEPMLYVFEDGAKRNSQIKELLSRIADKERKAYRFRGDAYLPKGYPPLQTADIFAYESRKEMCRIIDPNNKRAPRRSFLNMLAPSLDLFSVLDGKHFQKILEMSFVQDAMSEERYAEEVERAKKKKLI